MHACMYVCMYVCSGGISLSHIPCYVVPHFSTYHNSVKSLLFSFFFNSPSQAVVLCTVLKMASRVLVNLPLPRMARNVEKEG